MGGVRSGKFDLLVVRSGLLKCRNDLGQHAVDAVQLDLGNMQSSETDLGQTGTATDIQDSVARPGTKRLRQKFSEVVVPPSFTQILQRGGLEAINRRNHRWGTRMVRRTSIGHGELAGNDRASSREHTEPRKIGDEAKDAD